MGSIGAQQQQWGTMIKLRSVDSREAVAFGVNEAFVLNHFRIWIGACKAAGKINGLKAAFMSRRELHQQLPFISEATLWRKVRKLERLGILLSKEGHSRGRRNRTKWYAINEEKLKSCLYHHDTNKQKCLYHGDTNYYIEKDFSFLEEEDGLTPMGPELTGKLPESLSEGRKMGKQELEKLHKDIVAKKLEKPLILKPTKLAEYWRLECSLHYDDMAMAKTPKDKELWMWKHILAQIPPALEGREKPFLQFVIDRWKDSTQTIKVYEGANKAPTRPSVGYLLEHLPRFVHFFDDSTGSTEVIQSSKVNLSAQEETTKPLPTLEEALKSLGVSYDEHGGTNDSA